MGNRVRIKFEDFRKWIYDNKNNTHFFSSNNIPYTFIIHDVINRPATDQASYNFRYFTQHQANKYGNMYPEGVYLQLIDAPTL